MNFHKIEWLNRMKTHEILLTPMKSEKKFEVLKSTEIYRSLVKSWEIKSNLMKSYEIKLNGMTYNENQWNLMKSSYEN